MSTDNIDPSNKDATISSTDDVTKTTNKSDMELSEEQLKRVSGGLKFELTNVLVSSPPVSGSGGDPPPEK
jgi:hypothetical protein